MRRSAFSRTIRSCSSGSTRTRRRHSQSSPGSLRVQGNRIVPPGGEAAVALWEPLTLEKVTRPERFIQQLFELTDGRLAYLYDVIGVLDPARQAFALGLWMPNTALRLERFKALALGVAGYREAHLRTLPLGRASYDLSMTLSRIQVGADGTPAAPATRGFWSRVFAGSDLPDDVARQLRGIDEDSVDAAWLVETIASVDVRVRAERLDQLAFGQRLFGAADAAARPDVFVAIRSLARYRMLTWTIERIGIRAPSVYAGARTPGGTGRVTRRPPRFRSAGTVSGRARDPRADRHGRHAERGQDADAARAARRVAAHRRRPLCRRRCAMAAHRSRRRDQARRQPWSWPCSRRCPGRRQAMARSRAR